MTLYLSRTSRGLAHARKLSSAKRNMGPSDYLGSWTLRACGCLGGASDEGRVTGEWLVVAAHGGSSSTRLAKTGRAAAPEELQHHRRTASIHSPSCQHPHDPPITTLYRSRTHLRLLTRTPTCSSVYPHILRASAHGHGLAGRRVHPSGLRRRGPGATGAARAVSAYPRALSQVCSSPSGSGTSIWQASLLLEQAD